MDPILEEILRVHDARDIQPHSLRRWQHHLRTVIAPALDRLDAAENDALSVSGAFLPPHMGGWTSMGTNEFPEGSGPRAATRRAK